MITVPRYVFDVHHTVKTGRRLSGAAFLLVSQGLVWGLALGYCGRRWNHGIRKPVQLASLPIVIVAWLGIVSGQLRVLPDFRLYAAEWDERHALLLELRDMGQSDVTIPARDFSLWAFIRWGLMDPGYQGPLSRMAKYYGLNSITLIEDG